MSQGEVPLTELVAVIARALVDEPANVEVSEVQGGGDSVIELRVGRDDVGKVIGKDGRTAQSIRMLLSAASTKFGKRVHLDIVD